MAIKKDYYEVLGVPKDASQDDIKKAYRKLAKECHPDLHPDDKSAEAKFKEINEANEVLSDPEKRARYDQFGAAGPDMGGFGGGNPFEGFGGGGFSGFGGFESIFDQLFGGAGSGQMRANAPRSGDDLQIKINISFEEAAFGCKKSFDFSREENCEVCHGTGAKPGTTQDTCPVCHGTGQQRVQTAFMTTVRTCQHCGGSGKIVKEHCTACSGRGRVIKKRTANINIPAGIADGQVIILNNQGESGYNGGPSGDLHVYVSVLPHKLFKRREYDLFFELPISFTQATLGAELDIPTLEGKEKYRIPEGTQPGAVIKLKGKGIKHINSSAKGDLIVTLKVEIPRKLNENQKNLLKQLEDSMTGKEYQESKGFFEKMKDLFNFDGGSNEK